MIVRDIQLYEYADRVRLRGEIIWEDNDKPAQELWYEVEAKDAGGFVRSGDPFLLAGYAMACCFSETRCRIEGVAVCPVQAELMSVFARAFQEKFPVLKAARLETPGGYVTSHPGRKPIAAAYISGGVDSLAMLYRNTMTLSVGHPERFQEALCIFGLYGFDCPQGEPDPERLKSYHALRKRMEGLSASVGVKLVAAYTNIRSLIDEFELWSRFLYAPLHASVAHAFRDRWTSVWQASDGHWQGGQWNIKNGVPSVFSSSALSFEQDSPLRTRLQRVRDLSHWGRALKVCQPCHWVTVPEDGQINCGSCEKCIRTMLELLVCGKLAEASAFPQENITGNMIEKVWLGTLLLKLHSLVELIPLLEKIGRHDLACSIRRRSKRFYLERGVAKLGGFFR